MSQLPHMIFPLLFIALTAYSEFSHVYEMPVSTRENDATVWELIPDAPFDEVILSWNALRTSDSQYTFFVSLRQNEEWSPWLFYGDWGKTGQMLPMESPPDTFAETNRGIARPKKGLSDGLRVQIHASGQEKLFGMKHLFATLSNLSQFKAQSSSSLFLSSIHLQDVPQQSINLLCVDRHWDMTMVASMLSALRYLSKSEINIEEYISYIMDNDFESFDFWPLNAGEAYHRLGGNFRVFVKRFSHFEELHSYLLKGTPAIVSIMGTPAGGIPWPPYRSHILCIIGYDSNQDKVLCLDPVFPNNKATAISYTLSSFLSTWGRRQNIALVFEETSH